MRSHAQRGRGARCCGPRRGHRRPEGGPREGRGPRGRGVSTDGPFGIRRPLRFLAHKLGLDAKQTKAIAAILDDLKIERTQGAVDDRRAHKLYALAVAGETFDAKKAAEASKLRVNAAARLDSAVVEALQEIHTLLDDEQRGELGLLIRTGPLVL